MKNKMFEQQGASTYLVYEFDEADVLDSMCFGMLMNNNIPGFAQTVFTQLDNKRCVKYDVTARVSAAQYLHGTINRKRLLGVLRGIVTALLSAEDYMIDVGMVNLELDCIFSDVATSDTVLICLPVADRGAPPVNLLAFFKDIMFSAQYDERENRDYVAKIVSYLNGAQVFSATEFKGVLDYLASEPTSPQPVPAPAQAAPQQTVVVSAPSERKPEPPLTTPAAPVKPEDSISLFYLLQHYNKENAANYKAQKEVRKSERAAQKEAKKAAKKAAKEEKRKGGKMQEPVGFAVPGQEPAVAAQKAAPERAAAPQSPMLAPAQPQPSQMQTTPQMQTVSPGISPSQAAYIPTGSASPALQQSGFPVEEPLDITALLKQESDETVIMGTEEQSQRIIPHLLRKRNNERVLILKEVFRLGRDVDYNDYAIAENRYIGHSHCHILTRDGEYFVVDDNSKNRTRVNGTVVTPGEEVKLAHGYRLELADEEFEFKLF